jgi:hypothetical protein
VKFGLAPVLAPAAPEPAAGVEPQASLRGAIRAALGRNRATIGQAA